MRSIYIYFPELHKRFYIHNTIPPTSRKFNSNSTTYTYLREIHNSVFSNSIKCSAYHLCFFYTASQNISDTLPSMDRNFNLNSTTFIWDFEVRSSLFPIEHIVRSICICFTGPNRRSQTYGLSIVRNYLKYTTITLKVFFNYWICITFFF